jgi:hypothetical protein
VPGSLVGVVLNHLDVRGGIRVAPTDPTCDLANTDGTDARLSGRPVSAAAPASAVAQVIGKVHADRFPTDLADRTVAEARPDTHGKLPVVGPDATVPEVAASMARARSPMVAVVDGRETLGAITLDALLDRMFAT